MDQVKEQLQKNTAILDPYAAMIPALVDASAKAGVNPGLLLAAIGSLGLLILLVVQGWSILVTTITVLYPAVHSIRAIETDGKDDDKVWLTYWMVFGIFTTAETFFGFVFYIIPYWDWLRMGFFIWLLLPNFNGAAVLYNGVIKNLLAQNKDLIAKWIKMTTSVASNVQADAMAQAKAAASDPTLIAQGVSLASQAQSTLNESDTKLKDTAAEGQNSVE